jgi:hypothetical protein
MTRKNVHKANKRLKKNTHIRAYSQDQENKKNGIYIRQDIIYIYILSITISLCNNYL